MANSRISNLPLATAISGTEPIAIVQSSETRQLAISALESFIIPEPVFICELMDAQELTFYAPYAMKIVSVDDILNSPTTTIEVAGAAYTLGGNITLGQDIKVTASTASVVQLNATKS